MRRNILLFSSSCRCASHSRTAMDAERRAVSLVWLGVCGTEVLEEDFGRFSASRWSFSEGLRARVQPSKQLRMHARTSRRSLNAGAWFRALRSSYLRI